MDYYRRFVTVDANYSDHEPDEEEESWGGPASFEQLHIPAQMWPLVHPPSADCNMLPFRMEAGKAVVETLPRPYHEYLRVIKSLLIQNHSDVCYLTVDHHRVVPGESHRRGGLHTEMIGVLQETGECEVEYEAHWGYGQRQGGRKTGGIYMASSREDCCAVWACQIDPEAVGRGGDLQHLKRSLFELQVPCHRLTSSWITDRTPHESLPLSLGGLRTFLRVVAGPINVWYSRHNTANPLCPLPSSVRLLHNDKFAQL